MTVGTGDYAVKLGGETVLFRHEKTFFNKPGLAILITSRMDDKEVSRRLAVLSELQYERVGLNLRPEIVAVKDEGDKARFLEIVKKTAATPYSLILMSADPAAMKEALEAAKEKKPLIYAATIENAEAMAALSKEYACPLAAKAEGLESLPRLSEKLVALGVKDMVLDSGARTVKDAFADQVAIRRAALQSKFKPFGFPTITLPCEMTDDLMKETLIASLFIAKYAGIIVLSDFAGENVFPLLLERLNIYTDPQRPMTTEQGIYPINNPDAYIARARDLQLFPYLFHRLRRDRELAGALLALRHGYGRSLGHDRLGRRQVRRRYGRPLPQEDAASRKRSITRSSSSPATRRHPGRSGRRAARLGDHGRSP